MQAVIEPSIQAKGSLKLRKIRAPTIPIASPKQKRTYGQQALVTNDVAMLDELFWQHPATIRYGVNENLCDYEEVRTVRTARLPVGLVRTWTWAYPRSA